MWLLALEGDWLMIRPIICAGVSLFAALLTFAASPAKASLIGATVSIGGYCCSTPTAPDLFTNIITGTVAVSFPVGSLHTVTGLQVIPASFSVTADQISETSAIAARAAPGGFNGVVYDLSSLMSPITNVTVDPLSTLLPFSVTFTGDSVAVDVAGESIANGAKYILDVTTGGTVAAVPEPSTIALVCLSLLGLGVVRHRRRPRPPCCCARAIASKAR
jgi:hypothetical protein